MPTGYTAGVQDGTIADFQTFLFRCARAFGALVEQRDDPMDAPLKTDFEVSTYHAEKLAAARAELAELQTLTVAECGARADAEYESNIAAWRTSKQRREDDRHRYQSMLEHAKAWTPPTPEHQGLKTFMVQQLTDSMRSDCDHDDERWIPKRETAKQWHDLRLEHALRDVEYHKQHDFDERKIAAERREWVQRLRDSVSVLTVEGKGQQ